MAGGKLLAWKVGGKRGYFVGEVGGGGELMIMCSGAIF